MKDGLAYSCKTCAKARTRRYYEANSEKCKEYSRSWRNDNKERAKQTSRAYYAKPENKVKRNASLHRLYAKSNKYSEYWREYRLRNLEHKQDYYEMWRKANPEIRRANEHKRRSGKFGWYGYYSNKALVRLFEVYPRQCMCCGATKKLSCDHIRPLSKGGDGSIENLQILCRSCNSRKHAKTIDYRLFVPQSFG